MKRKGIRLLVPLAVVLSMVLALPMSGSALGSVDLSAPCSLKVHLTSNKEMLTDLQNVELEIDVYKVAAAVQQTANGITYDAYEFSALGAYDVESLDLTLREDKGWQDWQAVAQNAAQIALADDAVESELNKTTVTIDMKENVNPEDLISPLESGLYLLIVHGVGMEKADYVRTLEETETDVDLGIEKAKGSIVTVAYSDEYEYSFLPELVALPNKAAKPGEPDLPPGPLLGSSAADSGAWLHDFEIYLKPSQKLRYGSLEIVKDLREYATWDYTVEEATFVFQIEAERAGKKVYSDVVSLTFNQAGEQRVTIENKIPAGAAVTVTEVYSGSSYTIEGLAEKTTKITAAETASVEFTNTYDRRRRGGRGIINHFEPRLDNSGKWSYEWSNADDSLRLPPTTPGQGSGQTGTNPEATATPAPTAPSQDSGQTGTNPEATATSVPSAPEQGDQSGSDQGDQNGAEQGEQSGTDQGAGNIAESTAGSTVNPAE